MCRSWFGGFSSFYFAHFLSIDACAPCAGRTRLFWFIAMPNGALCAPPPIAASLFLIRSLKIDKKNYRTRAARVMGFPDR
ncbi:MAG: hypothetical protein ACK53Y_23815 [bacterium]